jgi:hypothetical protein
MKNFLAKVRVILTALPTYLAIVSGAIPVLLTVWVPLLPENVGIRVAAIGAGTLAVVGGVIETIRRLTPVIAADRGILPVPPVTPQVNVGGVDPAEDPAV